MSASNSCAFVESDISTDDQATAQQARTDLELGNVVSFESQVMKRQELMAMAEDSNGKKVRFESKPLVVSVERLSI